MAPGSSQAGARRRKPEGDQPAAPAPAAAAPEPFVRRHRRLLGILLLAVPAIVVPRVLGHLALRGLLPGGRPAVGLGEPRQLLIAGTPSHFADTVTRLAAHWRPSPLSPLPAGWRRGCRQNLTVPAAARHAGRRDDEDRGRAPGAGL